MSIELSEIIITDEDIDWAEAQLGYQFDTPRRDVIKCLESVDVQAFPGTGKTTVLVAKLAILAEKWPQANKGICVLSHTNTARREIEEKLGNTEAGRKLLSYPHFIGTIHSFFNTFVAIPWLRSKGYPIHLIDTDIVLNLRWRRLSYTAQSYLSKLNSYLQFCQMDSFPPKLGAHTETYKKLVEIKKASQRNGEFTFEEMLNTSRVALDKSGISNMLQFRFPILFIDEAQDTDDILMNLLESTFGVTYDKIILQSFGDINQAIFDSVSSKSTSSKFPRPGCLTITDSKRFSNKIASLANPMAFSKQKMHGVNTQFDKLDNKHAIFLFDRKKPSEVLPAFAQYLLSCLTDEELVTNRESGIYAVGQVGKEAEEERIPHSIVHYHPTYKSAARKKSPRPKNLISYYRVGRENFNSTLDS